jgi:nucleoside-diphosphate-sugar epimerase
LAIERFFSRIPKGGVVVFDELNEEAFPGETLARFTKLMKRVLVTGASGFVGRHTLKTLLQRGFDVQAIAAKNQPSDRSGCTWHLADLLDLTQIKELMSQIRPTHLLHFAWYAIPGKYWTSEENFSWVQASLELLRQFREQGGERVVMAGTCAEYDWNYGYCSEFLTPRNPSSPYGICKNALQEMFSSYSEQTSLSSAWGRIFFPYGPYEAPQRLVPSVIRSLLSGEVANCTHGNQIRDFMYVQDVADAFVALLESEVSGAVNIASGQPITLKEIVYNISNKIGHPELVNLGAIPVNQQEPPLLVADVTRLSNEVKWSPKFKFDIGLEQTINWWKIQMEKIK